MSQNQIIDKTKNLTFAKKFMSFILGCGVVLAATHGAFASNGHVDLTPAVFANRLASELHIHNDFSLQQNHILVDPRSLRHTRSEGDKTAENDGLRGNWDVYMV